MIKSRESKNLGNIKDANIDEWDNTVEKILNEYKHIDFVIPGHRNYRNSDLLYHTIDLVEKHKKRAERLSNSSG